MTDLRAKLREIEELIASHEQIAHNFEEVIKSTPINEEIPKALELFAPKNLYGMTQALIASLKIQRIEILQKLDTREKLEYRLEEAIKEEDYELSASLRDQINELEESKRLSS